MSIAAAPWGDAGSVAILGVVPLHLLLWFVPPNPRERLSSIVYTNVTGMTIILRFYCAFFGSTGFPPTLSWVFDFQFGVPTLLKVVCYFPVCRGHPYTHWVTT